MKALGGRVIITPLLRVNVKAELDNGEKSKIRKAKLLASRKETVSFPIEKDIKRNKLREFLSEKAGIEALLNTRALQSFLSLPPHSSSCSFTYRCTLDKIQFLKFEVTPVIDLRVSPTDDDCTVELLSCKFQGSEAVEQQNDHFSAFMRNYITWREEGDETFLDFDVKLELSLDVYTKPFTMLPLSAVEKPGNLVMQGVLDRLVPLLIQQLLQDYNSWLQLQNKLSSHHDSPS
ncbi:hypothetical protein LUZ60_002552 [Juncus effusus]|nr:hypothetical protein LUZ60_002552 [Juncus effusus]